MRWIDGTIKLIKGSVICDLVGEKLKFSSGIEAYMQISKMVPDLDRISIESISSKSNTTLVKLVKVSNDMDTKWIDDYRKKHGKEPNLFDGA